MEGTKEIRPFKDISTDMHFSSQRFLPHKDNTGLSQKKPQHKWVNEH